MLILFYAIAYLLGSIPCGLLLVYAVGMGDVRKIGSGNIGATNVLRTGNKKIAALTLLLDLLKGVIAVWLAREFGPPEAATGAAIFAVIGHVFPVWLGFHGGKGVATGFGAFLGLSFVLGATLIGLWLLTFAVKRISSLSALVAFGSAPIAALLLGRFELLQAVLPIALLVVARHKENIERLRHGTELRFALKEK